MVTLSSGSITGTGTLDRIRIICSKAARSARAWAARAGMTKSTAGTVILSGANTFSGATSISGGILQVNTNNALGTVAGGTTVSSGAALKLNNVELLHSGSIDAQRKRHQQWRSAHQ